MKLEHFLTPYTKINSKWINYLNVRPETIKLLEENIRKTLSDINHSRILYDLPPRILEIKAKINKWDLINNIKSLCITMETLSKVKRQPSEWEKIKANEATDKELISKIYNQLLQLNSRKINDPIKKWAKELNRHFSKEDIQMANKHMKRCTFTASSFRIWNSSTGTPSPPLALLVLMLSKAHLTSHSRMSGSR